MPLPLIKAITLTKLKAKAINAQILMNELGKNIKEVSVSGPNGLLGGLGKSGGNAIVDFFLGLFSSVGRLISGFVNWSVSSLVGIIQNNQQYIWNFNWNISDEEIENQIQSQLVSIASIVGGVLGQLTGYVTCGLAAGALIATFNPNLAKLALADVTEEAKEEFLGNVHSLIQSVTYQGGNIAFLRLFQNNRAYFNFYSNAVGNVVDFFVPGNLSWNEYVNQRKATNGYVSFSDFIDESIESIDNPISQAFFEGFFDEFGDGCYEALYVAANSIDNFYAAKRASKQALGTGTVVKITPNREVENETVFLAGKTEILKPAITQTMANYQLLENRDVGQFVGSSVGEFVRGNPMKLRVNLMMFPYPEPPFWRGDRSIRPSEVVLTIPDMDRTKLDWEMIKLACGGSNGYMWGRFIATARLDNGRSLKCFAATEDEAENQIDRMLQLTEANLLTLSISDPQNRGTNQSIPNQRREPQRVYPGYVYIINRQEFLESEIANRPVKGNFRDKSMRMPLWVDTKPQNWNSVVNEMLRYGQVIGTNPPGPTMS